MKATPSPWIKQLDKRRVYQSLKKSHQTDIAIIGAGISGIVTAFFTLRNTNLDVTIVEAYKLAHGATGHNAGQLTTYFEKPFSEIVKEYGLDMAIDAQRSVVASWDLLDEIIKFGNLKTDCESFVGYAGCTTLEQVDQHLENKLLRKKGGLSIEKVFISQDAPFLKDIPKKYEELYEVVPHEIVLQLIESNNKEYQAALSARKGVMNSALFCQELLDFMLHRFKHRLVFLEQTPVNNVELHKNYCVLESNRSFIKSKKVVLCTNGFEGIQLNNYIGEDINAHFHHEVSGIIGYMAGYLKPYTAKSTAISYFPKSFDEEDDPYYYLTRRKYIVNKQLKNLVCVGGPELEIEDSTLYTKHHDYPDKIFSDIKKFLTKNFISYDEKTDFDFHWHGLMGYTKSGLRIIGEEPKNKNLLYNLGCNGIGIMPSIYGGNRISQILDGRSIKPTIFDPK